MKIPSIDSKYSLFKLEGILQLIGDGVLRLEVDQRNDARFVLGNLAQVVLQQRGIADTEDRNPVMDSVLDVPLAASGDEQLHLRMCWWVKKI